MIEKLTYAKTELPSNIDKMAPSYPKKKCGME